MDPLFPNFSPSNYISPSHSSRHQPTTRHGLRTGEILVDRFILLHLFLPECDYTYVAYDGLTSRTHRPKFLLITEIHECRIHPVEYDPWQIEQDGAFYKIDDEDDGDFSKGNKNKPHLAPQTTLVKEVRLLLRLGEGGFGTVWLAHDMSPSAPKFSPDAASFVAVKQLPNTNRRTSWTSPLTSSPWSPPTVETENPDDDDEISLHTRVASHPNIVNVYRSFRHSRYRYLVMDYFPQGDLHYLLSWSPENPFVDRPDWIKAAAFQLIDAIQYMHEKGVYHRDIKPSNVLISIIEDTIQVAISDFGLATTKSYTDDHFAGTPAFLPYESNAYMPFSKTTNSNVPGGPQRKYPHDHHQPRLSSASGDIWCLGVVLFTLVCQSNPWKSATDTELEFLSYQLDPVDFFRTRWPISLPFINLLTRIFTFRSDQERIGLDELRKGIEELDTFYASEWELIAMASEESYGRALQIGVLDNETIVGPGASDSEDLPESPSTIVSESGIHSDEEEEEEEAELVGLNKKSHSLSRFWTSPNREDSNDDDDESGENERSGRQEVLDIKKVYRRTHSDCISLHVDDSLKGAETNKESLKESIGPRGIANLPTVVVSFFT